MNDQVKDVTGKKADTATGYRKIKRKQVLRVPMTDELLSVITAEAEADSRPPENLAMLILRKHFIK